MSETERPHTSDVQPTSPADVLIAVVVIAGTTSLAVARQVQQRIRSSRAWQRAGTVVDPVLTIAAYPPFVSERLQPGRLLSVLGVQGARERKVATEQVDDFLDWVVPAVMASVVRRADLTDLVTRYVDLDEVVSRVDLDRAVARVDLDRAVARVDLDAVASRLDVDAVAARLDLEATISRLDLTALVLERVDLHRVVSAVLDGMDLVGLAQEIIDGVDLPEIIRESTGAMASDTVRGARMQGIAADEAIARIMDRLFLHRGSRSGNGGPPTSNGGPPGAIGGPPGAAEVSTSELPAPGATSGP